MKKKVKISIILIVFLAILSITMVACDRKKPEKPQVEEKSFEIKVLNDLADELVNVFTPDIPINKFAKINTTVDLNLVRFGEMSGKYKVFIEGEQSYTNKKLYLKSNIFQKDKNISTIAYDSKDIYILDKQKNTRNSKKFLSYQELFELIVVEPREWLNYDGFTYKKFGKTIDKTRKDYSYDVKRRIKNAIAGIQFLGIDYKAIFDKNSYSNKDELSLKFDLSSFSNAEYFSLLFIPRLEELRDSVKNITGSIFLNKKNKSLKLEIIIISSDGKNKILKLSINNYDKIYSATDVSQADSILKEINENKSDYDSVKENFINIRDRYAVVGKQVNKLTGRIDDKLDEKYDVDIVVDIDINEVLKFFKRVENDKKDVSGRLINKIVEIQPQTITSTDIDMYIHILVKRLRDKKIVYDFSYDPRVRKNHLFYGTVNNEMLDEIVENSGNKKLEKSSMENEHFVFSLDSFINKLPKVVVNGELEMPNTSEKGGLNQQSILKIAGVIELLNNVFVLDSKTSSMTFSIGKLKKLLYKYKNLDTGLFKILQNLNVYEYRLSLKEEKPVDTKTDTSFVSMDKNSIKGIKTLKRFYHTSKPEILISSISNKKAKFVDNNIDIDKLDLKGYFLEYEYLKQDGTSSTAIAIVAEKTKKLGRYYIYTTPLGSTRLTNSINLIFNEKVDDFSLYSIELIQ